MFQWFTSIFSQPAQKAQLVAITISAILAMTVLLLNQRFTTKRSRKELYIRKIEELYKSMCDYELLSYEFMSLLFNGKVEEDETKNLLNKSLSTLQKIEMFVDLHFNEVSFDREKYHGYIKELYQSFLKEKESYDAEINAFINYTEVMEKMKIDIVEIKEICKSLMQMHKY